MSTTENQIKFADATTRLKDVPVWSYWEGPKPGWIQLCLRTLKENIPDIRILSVQDFIDMADSNLVPRNFMVQRPNVKSDFMRAYLLYYHGGIWLDADCIALGDVRFPWNNLERFSFFAYKAGRPAPQVCSAFIGSYKGGDVAREYLAELCKRLESHDNSPVPPLHLGPRTLHLASNRAGKRIYMVPTAWVHQIHWLRKEQLQASGTEAEHEAKWRSVSLSNQPGSPYCCMLTHRALGHLRSRSAEELLAGDSFVSFMFRKTLGQERERPVGREATPTAIPTKATETKMVHRPQIREVVNRIRHLTKKVEGRKVLDIGFTAAADHKLHRAQGALLHEHLCGAADSYYGLDLSIPKGFKPSDQVSGVFEGEIDSPDFAIPAIDVDLVVMGEVLEHLINPGIALDNIKKILQNSGNKDVELILTVPNALNWWFHHRAARGIEQVSDDHVCWYSPQTIRKLLEKTGWYIRDMLGYCADNAPRKQMLVRGSYLKSPGLVVRATPLGGPE